MATDDTNGICLHRPFLLLMKLYPCGDEGPYSSLMGKESQTYANVQFMWETDSQNALHH